MNAEMIAALRELELTQHVQSLAASNRSADEAACFLGGGRYDGLSEAIGGPKAPGIGFAIGLDRLVLTLQAQEETVLETIYVSTPSDAYIAPLGIDQNSAALKLATELRASGLRIELGDGNFRLKKSFEIGNKLAYKIVLLGEDELRSGMLTVKNFVTGEQTKIPYAELATVLKQHS